MYDEDHEETHLRRTLEDKRGSLGWEWRGWLAGRVLTAQLRSQQAGGFQEAVIGGKGSGGVGPQHDSLEKTKESA